jgi:hypothetical protein
MCLVLDPWELYPTFYKIITLLQSPFLRCLQKSLFFSPGQAVHRVREVSQPNLNPLFNILATHAISASTEPDLSSSHFLNRHWGTNVECSSG